METKDFTEILSKRTGLSIEKIRVLEETFSKIMANNLSSLDKIDIPEFGIFESKKKLERVAIHPSTGKKLLIPPKIFISFKPAFKLQEKINNGK